MTSIVMLRVWGSIPIMTGPRVVLILALLRSALMVSIGRHSYFGWHIPLLSLYRSGSAQDRANKMKASPPPRSGQPNRRRRSWAPKTQHGRRILQEIL